MTAPRTTVIFSNVPTDWTVGIDLQFFNSNALLRGIKIIPDGIHVVHWAQDATSVRTGFYFHAKEGDVHVIYWDEAQERMLIDEEVGALNVAQEKSKLSQYYPYMVTHPPDADWKTLTKHIEPRQVEYIVPKEHNVMDSVLTSTDENNVLLAAIKRGAEARDNDNVSNDPIVNSIIDQGDEEVKYTPIDLDATIRPSSTPQEKTHDALDKSWFLEHLITTGYNGNAALLLGEFELAFVNTIVFANYSSAVQWLKFLRVLLYCKDVVPKRVSFYEDLLKSLCLMLEKFPEEYADEFVDEDFFQVAVAEFDYAVKDLSLHRLVRQVVELKNILFSRFGISVRGIDDDDEDGPVVVDL